MNTSFSKAAATAAAVLTIAVTVSACGDSSSSSSSTTAPTSAAAAAPASASVAPEAPMPTADDLNAILAIATDPAAPVEQKVRTVQGGEQAPELFQTMTQSKQETGAQFEVVPPVLAGYTPDSVLTVVKFTLPNQEPQTIPDVEFVYEDGTWKLAQSWACSLIQSAVAPEKVPPMCHTATEEPAPAAPPAK